MDKKAFKLFSNYYKKLLETFDIIYSYIVVDSTAKIYIKTTIVRESQFWCRYLFKNKEIVIF